MRINEIIKETAYKKKSLHTPRVADEDYDPNGPPPGPEFKPTMPAGTVRVDVSDVYDWYKLGQHISNLKGLGKHDFGKGPPSTIFSFGSEPIEHKYIKDLEKTGLTTTDIDPVDKNQPRGMKPQKVDPTFNVNEAERYIKKTMSESLSRIAFHYTNNKTALAILQSGMFQLSGSIGSIEQQYAPKGYPYFLSTTRTRRGGYHRMIGQQAALFVLDGNWFNNHYISKPIDYWENRNPTLGHHRDSEAEDRVFSKDPTIPIDGVTAVHFYCDVTAEAPVKAWTRQALIAAKRQGIPAYFYTDKEAWQNFNTRKQGDLSTLTGQEGSGSWMSRHKGYLLPWMELIQAKERNQLSKKAESLRYSLQYGYNKDDATHGLKTDLSNARKPSGGADRANAIKIIKFMQQNGLTTVGQFVDALANKWKDPKGVTESFNQPYKLKWEKSEFGSYDALAKLSDGTNLSIMFNNEGDDEWHVEFYRNNSQEVTGEGDAHRVFATVLTAIHQFIQKKHPWRIIFSASKDVQPGQRDQSRANLYISLIARYARSWGYDEYNEDHGDQVTYELTRLKQGMAERKQTPLEDFEGLQFRVVNDNGQLFVNALSTGGIELGHVTFNIGDGKELDPQDLFVKDKYRSQGIARIMYDFVKSKGYKIQRSWDQTDDGAGFWNKHRGEDVRVWEQGVAENFADGKNPQDKGDSKRYHVPTKASVSTLRKVAKQGGRKGQLAHWMANMKAGRAKDKK